MVDDKHLSVSFIEQAVIGCCLTEKGLIKQALASLNENDFYHTNTRKIFNVIKEQYLLGHGCDTVLLKQHVDEKEYKFAIGCITSVTNIGFFKDYIIRVKENSVRHQLKQIGIEIQDIDCAEIASIRANVLARISGLQLPEEEKQDRMEVMISALKELERLRLRGDYEMHSKISGLDEAIGGICRQRVYVLGARPGFGKTTIAVMCSYKIATFDHVPVNYYSVEMSTAEIVYKVLTLITKIPYWKMQKPKYLLQKDMQVLFKTLDVIYNMPLRIKTEHKTLEQILNDIQKTKPGLAVIDHLQHLPKVYTNRNEKEREIYERYMKDIIQCSKENNCAIFVLSQANRASTDKGATPDQSNFSGSAAIEQLADTGMILHWPSRIGGKIHKEKIMARPHNYQEIHIVKNRFGILAEIPVIFEGEFQIFTECDKDGNKIDSQGGGKDA